MVEAFKVSIPFTSGNSFLPQVTDFLKGEELCQSPSRRGTHFYLWYCRSRCRSSLEMCQSPSRRGTHFYSRKEGKNENSTVSIPFTSGNSFLRSGGGRRNEFFRRRVSIPFTSGNSFLPSPLFFVEFMRVSSLDFRGICQTILKTAVFSVTSAFLSIFYKRAEYERHAFL